MRARTIFIDSSIVIQCKDLSELPWSELFQEPSLELVFPRAVVREIDSHKSQGNMRRASRARRANALFTQILDSPDEVIILRDNNPRIVVRIASGRQGEPPV